MLSIGRWCRLTPRKKRWQQMCLLPNGSNGRGLKRINLMLGPVLKNVWTLLRARTGRLILETRRQRRHGLRVIVAPNSISLVPIRSILFYIISRCPVRNIPVHPTWYLIALGRQLAPPSLTRTNTLPYGILSTCNRARSTLLYPRVLTRHVRPLSALTVPLLQPRVVPPPHHNRKHSP